MTFCMLLGSRVAFAVSGLVRAMGVVVALDFTGHLLVGRGARVLAWGHGWSPWLADKQSTAALGKKIHHPDHWCRGNHSAPCPDKN